MIRSLGLFICTASINYNKPYLMNKKITLLYSNMYPLAIICRLTYNSQYNIHNYIGRCYMMLVRVWSISFLFSWLNLSMWNLHIQGVSGTRSCLSDRCLHPVVCDWV